MSTNVELRNVKRTDSEPQSFDSTVAPIYQEAMAPRALTSFHSTNTSPGPAAANEYDIIKDKAAASRSAKRQQTENPLYGDHGTLPVAHPTLTHEGKQGNDNGSVPSPSSERLRSKSVSPSVDRGGRSSCCTCLLSLMVVFTLFVAVAALVLAILLFVGVKSIATYSTGSVATQGLSGSSCPTTAPSSTVDYQKLINELNSTIQNLSAKVSSFPSQVALSQNQFSTNISNKISSLSVSGFVQNFSVCQTSNVTTCSVNGSALYNTSTSCNTSAVPTNITGSFTLNAYCATSAPDGFYPVIATLVSNTTTGYLKCNCYIIATPTLAQLGRTTIVWCSLYMTTCPIVTNVSLRVV